MKLAIVGRTWMFPDGLMARPNLAGFDVKGVVNHRHVRRMTEVFRRQIEEQMVHGRVPDQHHLQNVVGLDFSRSSQPVSVTD